MIKDNTFLCIIALLLGFLFAKHCSNMESFASTNTAFDKLNRAGCCVGNTAGYTVQPLAVSPMAPGFSTIGAFNNPCMPMK